MVTLNLDTGLAAAVVPAASSPAPSPELSTAVPATTIATSPVSFSPTGFAQVSGTRQPGSSVVVTLDSTGEVLCSIPAGDSTEWSCPSTVDLPNGAAVALTALESNPSGIAPAPGSTTIDVLAPPILDGDGSYLTTGLISGSGRTGATVTVTIDGTVDSGCTVRVSEYEYWSCNIGRATGGPYTVRAQQSDPAIAGGSLSGYSNIQRVSVDRDAPARATITSPAANSRVARQPVAVTGTGETGATVDVYLDNVPVCSTVVADAAWQCVLDGVPDGTRTLLAVQRDAAGNYAAPSDAITVVFGASTAAPAPGTPSPTPVPETPEPEPGTPAPADPSSPALPPGPDGSAPTIAEALSNWGTPTGFGSALLAPPGDRPASAWYTSPLLGLVFLALVALPLRLLASAMRGRIRMPAGGITGRNRRPSVDTEVPKPVNAWLAAAVPLAATAGLAVLAGGVNGEVRYLRLFLAVGLGLVILNIVGAAVATALGSRLARTGSRLRFLPLMLLAAVASSLISRWLGVDPPLVVGVLAGAVFAVATPVRQRAVVNLVQIGVVLALGIVGWLAHAALGPVEGFWASVASETLATICLAGLGSALVLVLPLATLPGRVILEWSLPAWIGTVLIVAITVAAVVFGDALAGLAMLPLLMAGAVFAALSLAAWVFVRFVEPRAT